MLVVQDTNPAVWTDGVYAFVVFAELEVSNWAVFRLCSTSGRSRVACSNARVRRSGCHCKFTTRLWKMLVVQDTNPAVRVDGVYAFVVFAELIEL